MNIKEENKRKGFTLVELMVSIGIFALMTALLLAKYGTYNQNILLTNLAYDIALTIRNAQVYGLNVRGVVGSSSTIFTYPHGVHFANSSTQFIFFADQNDLGNGRYGNGIYDGPDVNSKTTTIKGGSTISNLCVGSDELSCTTPATSLDITFRRPDPNAIIAVNDIGNVFYPYAEITIQSSNGSTKKIIIRSTGQISVQ